MTEDVNKLLRTAIVIRNARRIQVEFYKKLESIIRGHNLNDTTREISWKLQRRYDCFKSAHESCQEKVSLMRRRYEESVIQLDRILEHIIKYEC